MLRAVQTCRLKPARRSDVILLAVFEPPEQQIRSRATSLDFTRRNPTSLVAENLLCRRCGYNLRGLAYGARCPECNAAVELSAQGDAFRFADPLWLGRLSTGAAVLMAQKILFIGWTILRLGMMLKWRMRFNIDVPQFLLQAASLVGWWIMSTPDPSGLGESDYGRQRRFTRVASIAAIIVTILSQFRAAVHFPPDGDHALGLISQAIFTVLIAGEVARYTFIAGLALRVPNDALARRARAIRVAAPIIAGVHFVLTTAILIASMRGNRIPGSPLVFGCFGIILLVAEIILSAVLFNLFRELWEKIQQQQRVASRFWAAHER
jgi:predicted Zn-ribbon and HTH transcriptional regulator